MLSDWLHGKGKWCVTFMHSYAVMQLKLEKKTERKKNEKKIIIIKNTQLHMEKGELRS